MVYTGLLAVIPAGRKTSARKGNRKLLNEGLWEPERKENRKINHGFFFFSGFVLGSAVWILAIGIIFTHTALWG